MLPVPELATGLSDLTDSESMTIHGPAVDSPKRKKKESADMHAISYSSHCQYKICSAVVT